MNKRRIRLTQRSSLAAVVALVAAPASPAFWRRIGLGRLSRREREDRLPERGAGTTWRSS